MAGLPASGAPGTRARASGSAAQQSRTQSRDAYAGAHGNVGDFARTLLRPNPATRLIYDVLYQPGAVPRQTSLDHVLGALRQVSGKPVDQAGPRALPPGDSSASYTPDSLARLADDHTDERSGGSQAVLHVLFLHGTFEGDKSVLGVAVRGDLMAVFEDQVASTSTLLVSAAAIEEAVTTHETGHLLGLVGLVIDAGRQDPQHPGHSTNPKSVMYWAIDSSLLGTVLNGPPPVDFDSTDLADLAALRHGA